MASFKRKRFWSRGKSSVYQVSGYSDNDDLVVDGSTTHKQSDHVEKRPSFKAKTNFCSLEASDGEAKPELRSRDSSPDGSPFEMTASANSFVDEEEEDNWSLLSADDNEAKLLSSQKRGSIALDEILLQPDTDDNDSSILVDDDVKDIVAAIKRQQESISVSETDSINSGSSKAASVTSDAEDVSSDQESEDEESEDEPDQDNFDVDAHVKKLLDGGESDSGSESDSDAETGSDTSEKAFQKVIRKVMSRIKRERSEDFVSDDEESEEESEMSEKGSKDEKSSNSETDSSSITSEEEDDLSDASSTESEEERTKRDFNPDIAELLADGLVINSKTGQKNGQDSRVVYQYFMNDDGRICSKQETVKNEDPAQKDDRFTEEVEEKSPKKENHEERLAATLNDDKVEDLRWPFSTFYLKEFDYDGQGMQALPSYRSTEATASHPGRKRNVMLGRVWWVEWWAMEDTDRKKPADKSFLM